MKELKRRNKLLLLWLAGMLFSVQAFAQSITVNGVVKDNLGEPVTVISPCKRTKETLSPSPSSDTKPRNSLRRLT